MSDSDDKIEQILLSEPAAARITPASMEEMLSGFALAPQESMAWFAEKIRLHVWVIARSRLPVSNAEQKDEALRLASMARTLFGEIMRFRAAGGEEDLALVADLEKRPGDFRSARMMDAYGRPEKLVELSWFLELLAERLDAKKQPQKWRVKAQQKWRVWFAVALSEVFEQGFGRTAAVNNWPAASGQKWLGHWADFYQRVLAFTVGEAGTPNLEGVLKEARRQIKRGDIRNPYSG